MTHAIRHWIGILGLALLLAAAFAVPAAPAPSTKGMLLVAARSMPDGDFARTVIYMVEHDRDGAMGLVINRPLVEMPLAKFLDAAGIEADDPKGSLRVHYGGPVQSEIGFLLHPVGYTRGNTVEVDGRYAMTLDQKALADIAEGSGPERYVFTLGYAGWSAEQLERELARGDWFTVPADAELIFADDPEATWERAVARRGIDL